MAADHFWGRVGQQLSIDQAAARLITEAVLETLAERIAAGKVEDLIPQLDPLLHPPLRRRVSTAPGALSSRRWLRQSAPRNGST